MSLEEIIGAGAVFLYFLVVTALLKYIASESK